MQAINTQQAIFHWEHKHIEILKALEVTFQKFNHSILTAGELCYFASVCFLFFCMLLFFCNLHRVFLWGRYIWFVWSEWIIGI